MSDALYQNPQAETTYIYFTYVLLSVLYVKYITHNGNTNASQAVL